MSVADAPDSEPAVAVTPPRRAYFVLPSLLTVLNLFLGYYAVVLAFRGEFFTAALLVLLAAVLDKLDGLVARATGTSSDFGRELDSLADVISFGVAPSLLAFAWALHAIPKLGWCAAFLFLTCGALRLARFNVQSAVTDHRYFVGLPIPMAAAVPVSVVLAHSLEYPSSPGLESPTGRWLFLALVVVVGSLMVSRVRYHSFKEVRFGRERRLLVVLGLVVVVAAVAAWPGVVLPAAAFAYAGHGPLMRAGRAVADIRRRPGGAKQP